METRPHAVGQPQQADRPGDEDRPQQDMTSRKPRLAGRLADRKSTVEKEKERLGGRTQGPAAPCD